MKSALGALAVALALGGCVTDSGTNPTGLHGAFFVHSETGKQPDVWTGSAGTFETHLSYAIPNPDETFLIVFNHGTDKGGRGQECTPSDDVPLVFENLVTQEPGFTFYYLCSNEIGFGRANNLSQSIWWKRTLETERLIDRFIEHGVPPNRIFLAGHSGGASVSLYTATITSDRTAGFIVFAPGTGYAYLDKPINDTWYSKYYYRWKNVIESGKHMRGLVFGFEDDKYSPVDEMAFIGDIPGIELTVVDNPTCSEGWISHFYGYTRCFRNRFRQTILETMKRWSGDGVVHAAAD